MRVLCFCPLRPKTDDGQYISVRIFGRTLQSIVQMDYAEPVAFHFQRDDYPAEDRRYHHISEQYNIARSLALRGGYDALFCLESDAVYPRDALSKLAEVDADIAYGLICSRHNRKWMVATDLWKSDPDGKRWGGRLLGEDDETEFKRYWGQVIPSEGVGMACTLIRRHVLERIEFRVMPGPGPGRQQPNDYYFAVDALKEGFKSKHHLGVVCGHITTHPAPMVIWPDPDAPNFYTLELMAGVRVEPVEPGEEIEADEQGNLVLLSMAEAREKGVV